MCLCAFDRMLKSNYYLFQISICLCLCAFDRMLKSNYYLFQISICLCLCAFDRILKSNYYLFQISICLCLCEFDFVKIQLLSVPNLYMPVFLCVVFVKHTKVCLFHICTLWLCLCVVQEPIERRVIEQGMFQKHCKVEVYLMVLRLSQNSDMNTVVIKQFSREATISKFGGFCCCCFFPGLYCKNWAR